MLWGAGGRCSRTRCRSGPSPSAGALCVYYRYVWVRVGAVLHECLCSNKKQLCMIYIYIYIYIMYTFLHT